MEKITLWRTFYDRYMNYYYLGTDGQYYSAKNGQKEYKIEEEYEPQQLNIIVDSEHSIYLIELTDDWGAVYFDRMGNIVRQIGWKSQKEREETGYEYEEGEVLDGSGTMPIVDYRVIGIPVSLTPIDGKLELLIKRNQIVENRLHEMENVGREWTIGEYYDLFDIDYNYCHVFFLRGSSYTPYFGSCYDFYNLESGEYVGELPKDGDIHDSLLKMDHAWFLNVYSDHAEIIDQDGGVYDIIWFDRDPFDNSRSKMVSLVQDHVIMRFQLIEHEKYIRL